MPETWGIGVDLCAVSRMARAIEKAHFFTRVFTENERAYLQGRGRAVGQSAAAMFAAKEAVAKALGTGFAQGEDVAMNVTGCDGMGTGGCGDVLTGVIAALLAQGMSAWDAARVGAFYHGRAGEAAQKKLGARGVTAWDVCEALRIE